MTGARFRAVIAVGAVLVGTATLVGRSARPSVADTTATAIRGEGGTFAAPIINKMELDLDAANSSVDATYNELPGVDVGREDFAAGTSDYAVSELPLTSDEVATAQSNGRTFAYVPVAAEPVAVGFEVLAGPIAGLEAPVESFQVSVPNLANIFTDQIEQWNDARFFPDDALFAPGSGIVCDTCIITPMAPADPSAATSSLIQLFLNDPTSKVLWDTFAVSQKVSPDTAFETLPGRVAVQGGDLEMAIAFHPLNATTGLPDTNPVQVGAGDIGAIPMDWVVAPWDIPTLSIQDAAGAFVAPTTASMSAAMSDAQLDPSTNLVSFPPDANDAAAYAIPAMSYLVVPTSGLSSSKATALASLIRFALSPAGQRDVTSFGGVAVTPAMEAAGLKVADEVAAEANGATSTAPTTKAQGGATGAQTGAPVAGQSGSSGSTGAAGSGASTPPTTQFAAAPGAQPDPGAGLHLNKGSGSADAIALTSQVALPIPFVVGGIVLLLLGAVVQRRLRSRSSSS